MTKIEMPSRIVILTGDRGVGKSTVCHKTVGLAQARQYTCGGVLTLSRSNGERDVLDVRSGDVRQLTLEPDTSEGVIQGRFHFDPAVLAWGNKVLSQAVPCHLLVVDELGPLEMERRRGWVKAFDVLEDTNFALALVVVRSELLVQVQLKLPSSATTVFTVTRRNRDGLPDVLLKVLESAAAWTPDASSR